jgi:hypothetical protein
LTLQLRPHTGQFDQHAGSAKLSQPTGQKLSNLRRQQKQFSIEPILFLYYEESLVSSNLNSKQLRFHCAHPNQLSHLVFFLQVFSSFQNNEIVQKQKVNKSLLPTNKQNAG